MKKVYVTQDDSGHWYVIPFEMKERFFDLENTILGENQVDADQAEDQFIDLFSQYMTGGDLNNVQLYADISPNIIAQNREEV